MWPAFFIRVRPASRNAKPACMNMTRIAVTTTQMVEAPMSRSCFVISDLDFLEPQPGPVVRDVLDLGLPYEAVSRLVAADRGRGDRMHDRVGLVVVDDEHEHRLRQEARLEHAPAVLVRDAALTPVTDRLDHRHADVARLLL